MTYGKPKFRPSLRDQVAGNVRQLQAMGGGAELPPDLQASLDRMGIKPKREYRRRDAVDIDAVHRAEAPDRPLEAEVIRAVEKLLAVHPLVAWALRVNSGAASYSTASGKYAPVWFHRFVRGSGYRMPDFMGATKGGRIIALECKRPGFNSPSDQREREQQAFLRLVIACGGLAGFVTGADGAAAVIEQDVASPHYT